MKNAKIALRVNRYIKQKMVDILSLTLPGRLLVNELQSFCGSSDCPSRGRTGEECQQHGDNHEQSFVRHCDAHGNFIHLNVSKRHPVIINY